MKAIITINEKHNGIEIKFTDKPEKEIREQLKDNGFRWHNQKQLWCARNTEAHMTLAQSLVGEPEQVEPAADRPEVVLATFAAPTFAVPPTTEEQPEAEQAENAEPVKKAQTSDSPAQASGKFTKKAFYIQCKTGLELWSGYSDGNYYYDKTRTGWRVTDPDTGLLISGGFASRKTAANAMYDADMQFKINSAKTNNRYIAAKKRFDELLEKLNAEVAQTEAEQTEAAQDITESAETVKETQPSDSPAQPEENTLHGVKIGDLFYTSWGWEQTNVDFFQVIGFKGKQSVVVRQVSPKMVEEEAVSGMSAYRAYEVPDHILPPSNYTSFINDNISGDTRRLTVGKYNVRPYFKVGRKGGYQDNAYPYHGEALYESWYG